MVRGECSEELNRSVTVLSRQHSIRAAKRHDRALYDQLLNWRRWILPRIAEVVGKDMKKLDQLSRTEIFMEQESNLREWWLSSMLRKPNFWPDWEKTPQNLAVSYHGQKTRRKIMARAHLKKNYLCPQTSLAFKVWTIEGSLVVVFKKCYHSWFRFSELQPRHIALVSFFRGSIS